MNTEDNARRLIAARNTLRDKGVGFGIVSNEAKLDEIAVAFGEIENRGAIYKELQNDETYVIPEGYHNGEGVVIGLGGGGTDVSGVTATAPHVLEGDIFVDADGNEVAGTMPNNGVTGANLDTNNTSYSIPEGYTSGGAVGIVTETKSVTPTKSAQEITPSGGKVLAKVSVGAIPAEYQNVTPVTATAPHVLVGDIFVDAEGNEVEGTMPNNDSVSIVLEKDQTYTIPKGYHPGTGVVSRASGGEVEFTITVNVDSGATVTATKGSLSVSGTSVNGVCVLTVPEPGVWTIRATLNGTALSETTVEILTDFSATIIGLLSVSYNASGGMTYKDSGRYRYYTITKTGVLTLNRPAALEYWICGGGGNGGTSMYSSTANYKTGGGGGGGGYFKTGQNTTDKSFTITIGAAAADSSIVSESASVSASHGENGQDVPSRTKGGNGGAGASGGGGGYGGENDANGTGKGGSGGGVSTIPFGDSYFTSYPCAGGHGGSRGDTSYKGGAGGSNGANGGDGGWTSGTGGSPWASAATGGGTIGSGVDGWQTKTMPLDATYYGSAGAGGYANVEDYEAGSNGYQGVCFLRIPLSEFGL